MAAELSVTRIGRLMETRSISCRSATASAAFAPSVWTPLRSVLSAPRLISSTFTALSLMNVVDPVSIGFHIAADKAVFAVLNASLHE